MTNKLTPAIMNSLNVGVLNKKGDSEYFPISQKALSEMLENSEGGLILPAENLPKAPAKATVGVSNKYAREDHVHPAQTSITGNAGTATKLADPKNITLTGVVTGSASFDGSAEASITTTATAASTSTAGIVQLNDTTSSNSTTEAATANAVKTVNDIVTGVKTKVDKIPNLPETSGLSADTVWGLKFNNSTKQLEWLDITAKVTGG